MGIVSEGPLRRILRERRRLLAQGGGVEDLVREWRERGIPEPAISMALKMADRWLKAVLK